MEPPAQPVDGQGVDQTPVEEPWQPSREEWDDLVAFRNEVLSAQQQYEQQLATQQQGGQQNQPVISWLDDESRSELDQYVQQMLEQRLAPIQQFQQQIAEQEGSERAMDILNDTIARDGDFLLPDSKEKARKLADTYFPEATQRYGYSEKAAEAAIEQAVKDVRAWEQQVGKAYYDREVNQLRGLASAPREPGAAGTGAAQQQIVGGLGNRPGAVTSKLFGGQP